MPSYDEQIRGEREAIRIEQERNVRFVQQINAQEQHDQQRRADVRKWAMCGLAVLTGIAFALLLMMAARY